MYTCSLHMVIEIIAEVTALSAKQLDSISRNHEEFQAKATAARTTATAKVQEIISNQAEPSDHRQKQRIIMIVP